MFSVRFFSVMAVLQGVVVLAGPIKRTAMTSLFAEDLGHYPMPLPVVVLLCIHNLGGFGPEWTEKKSGRPSWTPLESTTSNRPSVSRSWDTSRR